MFTKYHCNQKRSQRPGSAGIAVVHAPAGQIIVPVRRAALWLVSNIPALAGTPHRIPLVRGLSFNDVATLRRLVSLDCGCWWLTTPARPGC